MDTSRDRAAILAMVDKAFSSAAHGAALSPSVISQANFESLLYNADDPWTSEALQGPVFVLDGAQQQIRGFPAPHDELGLFNTRYTDARYADALYASVHPAPEKLVSPRVTASRAAPQQPAQFDSRLSGYTQAPPAYPDIPREDKQARPGTSLSFGPTPPAHLLTPLVLPPASPRLQDQLPNLEDDRRSICPSNCSQGGICPGSTCTASASDCNDENCLRRDSDSGALITAEDAHAAAALASFGAFDQDMAWAGFHMPQWFDFSYPQAGPDQDLEPSGLTSEQLGVSSELLPNYRHLYQAHDPQQPRRCKEDLCPIDDPGFYQKCHIRQPSPQRPNLFDNITVDQINGGTLAGTECGVKLPSGQAMVDHFWTEHHLPPRLATPAADEHSRVLPSVETPVSPGKDTFFGQSTASIEGGNAAPLTPPDEPFVSTALPNHLLFGGVQMTPSPPATYPATPAVPDAGDHTLRCQWCPAPGDAPCGLVFANASELQNHVKAVHTAILQRDETSTFPCGWQGCGRGLLKGFPQKSKLERHIQVHTSFKPFGCEECGDSFSGKQALQQHLLIHSGEKPCECHICHKTFRQASALTMHIRSHTGEKPLVCQFCGRTFSESSNLAKHRRTHEAKGAYDCSQPACGKNFRRFDQLRRHQKHVHGIDVAGSSRSSRSSTPAVSVGDEAVRPAFVRPAPSNARSMFAALRKRGI